MPAASQAAAARLSAGADRAGRRSAVQDRAGARPRRRLDAAPHARAAGARRRSPPAATSWSTSRSRSSADEARELAALAARHGRLAIPFQNRRWDADILTLQRLLREGALGTVHRFESRYERWRPTPKPRWTVEGADARGEGLLLDLMVHLVDQALLLFGPARDVYAEFDRRHPQVARRRRRVRRDHAHERRALAPVHQRARSASAARASASSAAPGAFVKHGMDPQEDALLAGAHAGRRRLGRRGRDELGPARRRRRDPRRRERARQLPALLRRRRATRSATGAPPPVTAAEGDGDDGRARSGARLGARAPRRRRCAAAADPRRWPIRGDRMSISARARRAAGRWSTTASSPSRRRRPRARWRRCRDARPRRRRPRPAPAALELDRQRHVEGSRSDRGRRGDRRRRHPAAHRHRRRRRARAEGLGDRRACARRTRPPSTPACRCSRCCPTRCRPTAPRSSRARTGSSSSSSSSIGADGTVRRHDVYRALAVNHAKLDYEIGRRLARGTRARSPTKVAADDALEAQIWLQDRAAGLLKRMREQAGALELDTVAATPVAKDGVVESLHVTRKNRARDLIEDFMIAANGAVARFLAERGRSAIRRVVREPRRWDRIVDDRARRTASRCRPTPDAQGAVRLPRPRGAPPIRCASPICRSASSSCSAPASTCSIGPARPTTVGHFGLRRRRLHARHRAQPPLRRPGARSGW